MVRRRDGTLMMFDSNKKRVYEVKESYLTDFTYAYSPSPGIDYPAETLNIVSTVRGMLHFGDTLPVMKRPIMVLIRGKFQRNMYVTLYIWDDSSVNASAAIPLATIETAFVAGQSVMGSQTTTLINLLEAGIPLCVANRFFFQFESREVDQYFAFTGYQFTYQAGQRLI
jgi:hypothetical protein